MERAIAAIRLPDLALAAVCLREPQLTGQPLAIIRQGRVCHVDRHGQLAGIYPGMAAASLPHGIHQRPPATGEEALLRQECGQLLGTLTPAVTETRSGHWLIDLSGTTRLHHAPAVVTLDRALRAMSQRLATPAVAGMAANKTVAMLAEAAAMATKADWIRVLAGQEQRFLAPLPITLLPRIGRALLPRLTRLGIRRIGDLLACPEAQLIAVFGPQARLWRAWGMGADTVLHTAEPPPTAIIEPGPHRQNNTALRLLLLEACDTIGVQLRQGKHYLATLRIIWTDLDGERRERLITLRPPEDRTILILEAVWQTAQLLWQRRVMTKRITLTMVRVTSSRPHTLFPELEPSKPLLARPGLDETLDAIRQRYGREAIQLGR